MAKWITVAIVSGLFFSVGMIAGHGVPSTETLTTSPLEKSIPDRADARNPACSVPVDPAAAHPAAADSRSIELMSHATASENAEFHTVESTGTDVATDKHRKAIRNLIQQHFPDTDAVATGIWVETCADMSLDEISFLLEQKRRTSTGIEASRPATLIPSVLSRTGANTVPGEPLAPCPEQAGDAAVKMVEANLRSAYALGFRRLVVLPDAIGDLELSTPDKSRSAPVTSFRSFESGPLIASPIATHVALTKENSAMFCLEGNRLTRRGDFQLLADRRLGIVTSRGQMASADSTPLPEGATDIRILQNGTVQFSITGETCEAGRITVCSVTDLADLRSDDGVFFTVTDVSGVTRREDASAFLLTHRLEQSNVERSYENSLLTHLKSRNERTVE